MFLRVEETDMKDREVFGKPSKANPPFGGTVIKDLLVDTGEFFAVCRMNEIVPELGE